MADSTAGGKDLDVLFIDYSPGMSFVTRQLRVSPYCITAELCRLMLYLEMTTKDVPGKMKEENKSSDSWLPGDTGRFKGQTEESVWSDGSFFFFFFLILKSSLIS